MAQPRTNMSTMILDGIAQVQVQRGDIQALAETAIQAAGTASAAARRSAGSCVVAKLRTASSSPGAASSSARSGRASAASR